MNANTLILSTGPNNFAGAGAAHARILELMAAAGAEVQFWTPSTPFREKRLVDSGVEIVISKCISDAYPDSDLTKFSVIANSMVEVALNWLGKESTNRVIIFSTYLFPFCATAEIVARVLRSSASRIHCIIHPAGSDIWQVAKQMPRITKDLIDSPHITDVVTYSARFANEIKETTGSERDIKIIPPSINTKKFCGMNKYEQANAREEIGIGANEFVISHCSNHRPVKNVLYLIKISLKFASLTDGDVRLLLVGPMTPHLNEALEFFGQRACQESTTNVINLGKLRITLVGLQNNVRNYHALSDVALNTSVHDSFNISLGEAMACEVPVLTTDVAGIASLVEKYECGYTFPFKVNAIEHSKNANLSLESSQLEIDSAVDWLTLINSRDDIRTEMGRRARIAILENCADRDIARQWRELLCLP